MTRTEVAHGVVELVDQPSGALAEHRLRKPEDAGSTPALGSNQRAPQIRERRPRAGLGWEPQPGARVLDSMRRDGLQVVSLSVWHYKATRVISALEVAEYPDGKGDGPQWHLSFSRAGRRPGDHDLRRVLRAFGLVGLVYDEDNHHPGMARHLWIPVDPAHRVACQCKTDERTIVEPDGYRWTTPADGPCSGCDFAALVGKPCFLHPEVMP